MVTFTLTFLLRNFLDPGEFNEMPDMNRAIGQCHVIYDYESRQPDELTIRQGTSSLTTSSLFHVLPPGSFSCYINGVYSQMTSSTSTINKTMGGGWESSAVELEYFPEVTSKIRRKYICDMSVWEE